MGKGSLRFSEAQLADIKKRPGYGTGIVASEIVKTAQRAKNAVARLQLDPDDLALQEKARHALRIAAAANGQIEAMFELQLLDAGQLGEAPVFQAPAIKGRKFKLDVAFVRRKIGFEVQGHVHRIKEQFLRDMKRHNMLTLDGWTMYYVSGDMVRDGSGLQLVKEVVGVVS